MKNKESIRNDYRWEETNNYMDLEVGSRNGKKISVGGKMGEIGIKYRFLEDRDFVSYIWFCPYGFGMW